MRLQDFHSNPFRNELRHPFQSVIIKSPGTTNAPLNKWAWSETARSEFWQLPWQRLEEHNVHARELFRNHSGLPDNSVEWTGISGCKLKRKVFMPGRVLGLFGVHWVHLGCALFAQSRKRVLNSRENSSELSGENTRITIRLSVSCGAVGLRIRIRRTSSPD